MVTVYLQPIWLWGFVLIFSLSACEKTDVVKQYPLHYSDAIMGTSFTIKVSSIPELLNANELKFKIKSHLDNLNTKMSTYLDSSELSQFNFKQSTDWQTISEPLFTVIKEAKLVSKQSQGAFDITVGPLVNLWGFGPEQMTYTAPDNITIKAQRAKVGSEYLKLNEDSIQIKKDVPDLYLDLSAIAKGYAVDEIGLLLENEGITDYMIEIGGELKLKGLNIFGQPWRIAIEKPTVEKRMIQKVLPLTDISIATSGDYRNYFEVDNVRFSHTIDPRSGKPITHKLASITILSDTTMRADAYATALMVLGPDQGFKMAEEKKIAALFIVKTNDGFVEKVSPALKQLLQ